MPHPHLPARGRAGRAGGHLLGASLQRRLLGHLLCRADSRGGDPLQQGADPPMVWIEHYPPETTNGRAETFELVIFSSYEVKERAPYLGKTRLSIGEPTWKMLDRRSVETLIGQEV